MTPSSSFTTDWLSSETVFYNTTTGKASFYINDVVDPNNIELDEEGLSNYLLYGYSVFGQTPLKNVKFLPPHSSLKITEGKIDVTVHEDPVLSQHNLYTEDQIWEVMGSRVNKFVNDYPEEIVIPTSGGFDSRIMNLLVNDKSRIRSFTYGISKNQSDSYEVIYAKKAAEVLQTQWEQIPLGNFNLYLGDWYKTYGVATHAHGMYHIEFYKKIRSKLPGSNPLLSGIMGDAWSGKVDIPTLQSPDDVIKLSYSHGISIPKKFHQNNAKSFLVEAYFEDKKYYLNDRNFRIIESMRRKVILLTYLLRIPKTFEFTPWSPFLNLDLVLSILNLPDVRKNGRLWQVDFFKKHGLDIESMDLKASKKNMLDSESLQKSPLQPLNPELLKEVVKPDLVHWINDKLRSSYWLGYSYRGMAKFFRVAGFGNLIDANPKLTAYNYYIILWPIQKILEQRQGS